MTSVQFPKPLWLAASLALALHAVAGTPGAEEVRPGRADTEIKLGQTMPYSGPASAYGTIGKLRRGLLQDDQRRRAASTAARST